MSNNILNSLRKIKYSKKLYYENEEKNLNVNQSKFIKELTDSINDVVKGNIVIKIDHFEFAYPDFVRIKGTFDGSLTWMYSKTDTSNFMIKSGEYFVMNVDRANQLSKLTAFFRSDAFSTSITKGLNDRSFS